MAKRKNNNSSGGLKGFFTKASNSFFTGGTFVKDQSFKLSVALGKYGFIFATTCIVMFVPLVFEIAREGQMIESDKLQVMELRNQGYSDVQLKEMGYSTPSVMRAPSVLLKK